MAADDARNRPLHCKAPEYCPAMSVDETKALAEMAAQMAIEKMWLTMGVDVSRPEGVLELQADLRHIRFMRQLSGSVGTRALLTVVAVAVGTMIVLFFREIGIPVTKLPF